MRPYCPICDGGNRTLLEEILRVEGPDALAQCYSIPLEAIREHIRHSPELMSDGKEEQD
jgi:hypothetical protein